LVKLDQIIQFIENNTGNPVRCISKAGSKFELIEINKPCALLPGDSDGISFCNQKGANKLGDTACKAIIVTNNIDFDPKEGKVYICVADAKSVFIDVCDKYFYSKILTSELIHPTVIIDSESKVCEKTRIGPYSVIYRSQIGRDCVIYPGVVIYNAEIGDNVVIKSGTVIGYDGFGYYPSNGQVKKFPHYRKVIIENDVEIGSNTTIDRGALTDTIIRKGAKIDNLVHIAHGDEIGEQVIITAGVAIGGSVKIGQKTWLGIGAVIKNGIQIGKKAFVGMGAVVNKDVSEEKNVIGNLAIDRDIFIRNLKKTLEEK
jgi:UDP-3-O-[3-hydroxymyristoyl] glucosamine N-acyltransferase